MEDLKIGYVVKLKNSENRRNLNNLNLRILFIDKEKDIIGLSLNNEDIIDYCSKDDIEKIVKEFNFPKLEQSYYTLSEIVNRFYGFEDKYDFIRIRLRVIAMQEAKLPQKYIYIKKFKNYVKHLKDINEESFDKYKIKDRVKIVEDCIMRLNPQNKGTLRRLVSLYSFLMRTLYNGGNENTEKVILSYKNAIKRLEMRVQSPNSVYKTILNL